MNLTQAEDLADYLDEQFYWKDPNIFVEKVEVGLQGSGVYGVIVGVWERSTPFYHCFLLKTTNPDSILKEMGYER